MEDQKIIELYWARNEDAIRHTADRYGQYCYAIAYNILSVREDSEECVNDTYLDAWNSIPPHRPNVLSAFLGKITRRIALDRWRHSHAQKRGGGEIALALDELSEEYSAYMTAVDRFIEREEGNFPKLAKLKEALGGVHKEFGEETVQAQDGEIVGKVFR